jgi:hypothetical protein
MSNIDSWILFIKDATIKSLIILWACERKWNFENAKIHTKLLHLIKTCEEYERVPLSTYRKNQMFAAFNT